MSSSTSSVVSIPTSNKLGDCPGYVAKPQESTTMGVIILQEWWGVNDHIKSKGIKIAEELKAITIIPDLYRGQVATDHEHAGHLMHGLDWPGAIADILGAAKYLRSAHGCTKIGVTGFCMGGALTLAATASQTDGTINAASCFYGIPQMDVSKINVPVIAHFGELDDIKGFSDVEAANKLQESWKQNGVNGTVYIYPGCSHAFTNNTRPEVFNAEAYALSFERMYDFFRTNLQ
ncbi:dienelactone hydrolase family protein [Naegleria gruberi]|uniref:Dienelactone hydrolase family protein n=1 Tax=Naegleria gruberi TaxID=5762 RepID=D2VA87_NAEGR|nr:dienelactone hydrolase family protein [Naegleria gruberi]EFC46264.1 dienelactone hydrolase family protein [Naegleria gruberi]|eukprot:XP_002679008.1 dienelactone hydrolase family protein [Naegleria gruberi strain NEG-M]